MKPARISIISRTHGQSNTAEYQAWQAMKARCYQPTSPHFDRYGGRGIRVCDRWKGSFPAFLEDLGPMPRPGLELDRYPDNDGHYEPGNCRWADRQQQCRNRSSNVIVAYRGETKTLTEWCEILGLTYETIRRRIVYYGWTDDEALTTPIGQDRG
jgi:hypothetical protein